MSTKDWSEVIKNLAQVVALAVAAYWTYQMFVLKEAPTLQRRATSNATLDWGPANKGGCLGTYSVSLKNDGNTDFEVRQVRVTMWEFHMPIAASKPAFVDLDSIEGEPIFGPRILNGGFVRHFPPQLEWTEVYAWAFKEEPRRNVYIKVEFFADPGNDSPTWSKYSWGEVCRRSEADRSGAQMPR